ncbi:hypothetical protein KNP414_06462 [Paenibacillus mucilaginosus KNP414]|uniref:Uncharacterized protein n=1 Tax=Paenibacillus mucilaginosus (strain KNP414) TaxID=1036673 RepID=F8FNR4_PAEMK|nr:hypothetical protein KNP414_06462 [Paenibacillus mucilaginosus KNP414]
MFYVDLYMAKKARALSPSGEWPCLFQNIRIHISSRLDYVILYFL